MFSIQTASQHSLLYLPCSDRWWVNKLCKFTLK